MKPRGGRKAPRSVDSAGGLRDDVYALLAVTGVAQLAGARTSHLIRVTKELMEAAVGVDWNVSRPNVVDRGALARALALVPPQTLRTIPRSSLLLLGVAGEA